MNTFFRLLVLIPAALVLLVIAILGIGVAGGHPLAILLGGVAVAAPVLLIVWTFRTRAQQVRHD